MEVAAAVVSFVGLAGPVTQGLKFLYDFTFDIKSCPKDLRDIRTDLNLVESLIGLIVQRYQSDWRNERLREDKTLAAAISQAQESIRELGKALNDFGVSERPSRFARVQFAFKATQTQRLVTSLHRTKTLMLEIHGLVESDLAYDTNKTVHATKVAVGNVENDVQYTSDNVKSLVHGQKETNSSLKSIEEKLARLELLSSQETGTPTSSQSSVPSLRRESSTTLSQASTATMASLLSSEQSFGPSSQSQSIADDSLSSVKPITSPPTHSSTRHSPESRFSENTFQFLVACIFLQRIKVDKHRPLACEEAARCLQHFPNAQSLANATEIQLQPYFEKIGLKTQKPPLLIAFAAVYAKDPPIAGTLRSKPKKPTFERSEISHLPQVGEVGLKKWKEFCRDAFYQSAGVRTFNNG